MSCAVVLRYVTSRSTGNTSCSDLQFTRTRRENDRLPRRKESTLLGGPRQDTLIEVYHGRMSSSGMIDGVALVSTDVSEEQDSVS
jgi:hypothetical protein